MTTTERQRAIDLAIRVLGRVDADPDDDLAILARNLLRAVELTILARNLLRAVELIELQKENNIAVARSLNEEIERLRAAEA